MIGDSVTVTLGEVSEAGSLRGILTDKAVGVFIGASLPRVVGCGEVEVSAGGVFDGLVVLFQNSAERKSLSLHVF